MRVAVFGICGRMGQAICRGLLDEKGIKVVAGFDMKKTGDDVGTLLGKGKAEAQVYGNYEQVKKHSPDVIVDFTVAEAAIKTIDWAIQNRINIIVGTTGIGKGFLESIEKKAEKFKSKVMIVPNFSIGAVLMIKVSSLISTYFEDCEIIELHHDKKKDSPSGTSVLTSEEIGKAKKFSKKRLKGFEKETAEGSRGSFLNGIHVHSIRLPGLLAHQKVIFGTKGQTVTISHDSIDRSSFYPGVLLALKNLDKLGYYTYGLDKLIEI